MATEYVDDLYPQLGRMAYTEFWRAKEWQYEYQIQVNQAKIERSRAPQCADRQRKAVNHYTCHCGRLRFVALAEYRCPSPTCQLTREESLLRLAADDATERLERKNRGRTIMSVPYQPLT